MTRGPAQRRHQRVIEIQMAPFRASTVRLVLSDDRFHRPGSVIALLGAESTGKTTLARGLVDALAAQGRRVAWVEEFLREFCLREGRTPRQHEQAAIAHTQSQRIAEAARGHDIVVADTTALMIAVYSQLLFDDDSLVAAALAEARRISPHPVDRPRPAVDR